VKIDIQNKMAMIPAKRQIVKQVIAGDCKILICKLDKGECANAHSAQVAEFFGSFCSFLWQLLQLPLHGGALVSKVLCRNFYRKKLRALMRAAVSAVLGS